MTSEIKPARKHHKRFCERCTEEISYPENPTTAFLEEWNRRAYCENCAIIERKKRPVSGVSGVCATCLKTKPIGDFPSGNKKSKSNEAYKYAYCKECHSERERSRRLFALYRITSVEYDTILAYQGGVCAICKRPPTGNRLSVDHDHKTGMIRGLICWTCNRALGLLRDKLSSVQALVEYLIGNPAFLALGVHRYGLLGKAQFKKKMIYGSEDAEANRTSQQAKKDNSVLQEQKSI